MFRHLVTKNIPFSLCLLLACSGAPSSHLEPADYSNQVSWVKTNAVPIAGIQPDMADVSDLERLRTVIGDSRIVLLGEQTHGDGSTFSAKVRLIKFLHDHMGFDVLAFESSMYDCQKSWEATQGGTPVGRSVHGAVFPIWSDQVRLKPLWDFMDVSLAAGHPLELTGVDCQTGDKASANLVNDLRTYLEEVHAPSVASADWNAFAGTLQMAIDSRGTSSVPPEAQPLFYAMCDKIIADLSGQPEPFRPFIKSPGFWTRWLRSFTAWCSYLWNAGAYGDDTRDIQMAANLLWLANGPQAGKKIIVWAASYHIMHNLSKIGPDFQNTTTMGDHLRTALGDQAFSIIFSCNEGSLLNLNTNLIETIPAAPSGSIESILKLAGFQFCVLDYRHLPADANWFKGSFSSRPLGNVNMVGPWSLTADALFYIEKSDY